MTQKFIMTFNLLQSCKDQATQIYPLWSGKSKFFSAFHDELSIKSQHGRTQKPWSPVVQVLVGGGGHLGSNCCSPKRSPAASIWAPRWRWTSVLPANDSRTVTCHCLLVGLSEFLYNSVITGHRNSLRNPVVLAPSWDIGYPGLVVLNEAKNGFERGVPVS